TRTLTRMLVPNPKKAFQSPGTHHFSAPLLAVIAFAIVPLPFCLPSPDSSALPRAQSLDHVIGARHPAAEAALRLNHLAAHGVDLREIGAAAILEHEAVVAAVVGFPDRRVDAALRGHAGDDELLDVPVLQDRVQVGRVKRALARLVDDWLAGRGI